MTSDGLSQVGERLKRSGFAQKFVAPKVAQPLGSWLQTALDLDEATDERSEADDHDGHPPTEPSLAPAEPESVRHAIDEAAEPEKLGPKAVALAVKDRVKEHNLIVVAAGIAFWGLLAIPALLFALVSIGGLVFDPETIKADVADRLSGAPDEVTEIIGEQLESVSSGSTGGLITGLILGIILALWASSGAMAKLMATLNTIYGVTESRSFVKLRGSALLLTIGGIVFVVATMFVLAALPALLGQVDGIGATASWLFSLATYPVLGLVMVLGLGVLYRWGPSRSDRYRPITLGAVVATVLWVVCVIGFSVYAVTAASYNETYGSLGGLVMLLLFLLITALTVLIGAEVHQLTEDRRNP